MVSRAGKLARRASTLLTAISFSALSLASSATASSSPHWSGFFVGGNIGNALGNADQTIHFLGDWLTDGTQDNTFLAPFGNKLLKPNGFIGGAQAGYNYQIKHWVPGIVLDVDSFSLDANSSSGIVLNSSSTNTYLFTSSLSTDWLVLIRPQLGYAFGSWLPYITGGLAITHEKFSQRITQLNLDYYENGSLSDTVYGWTVGAGVKYAVKNHWQLMLEYLFVDFAQPSVTSTGVFNGASFPSYSSSHSVQLDANIIRIGVIYAFS